MLKLFEEEKINVCSQSAMLNLIYSFVIGTVMLYTMVTVFTTWFLFLG